MSASEIAALQAEVKEYRAQLATIEEGLKSDPDNAELQALRTEIEEVISLTDSAIAELKPSTASPTPRTLNLTSSTDAPKEKWSKENHPAYKAGYRPPAATIEPEAEVEETQTPQSFNVNDTVLARWKTGDGAFYNARITSKTGSSANPVYTVLFKSYGTTETCYARDIRPISNEAKKRKADNISTSLSASSTPVNGSVISAASTVDPEFVKESKKTPMLVSDGPMRPAKIPKKIGKKNELEQGKAKWQDFAAKSKGKGWKKDSMFKTGESVTARVGFAGSGQEMRKDPKKMRNIYEQDYADE